MADSFESLSKIQYTEESVIPTTPDMRVTFKGIIGAPASGIYTNWVIREQISCANWEGLSSDEVVDDTETI